jgi:hypothetical protein
MSIENVVVFLPDLMVAVFDKNGEQMGEFQGLLSNVRDKILAASDENTSFYIYTQCGNRSITKKQFSQLQQEEITND